LSSFICNDVVKFLTYNMRMNPNMKDVVKKCLVLKSWGSHATHLLLESQVCDVVHDSILFEFSSRSYTLRVSSSMCIN
jgi:hypothetical protein